MPVSWLCKEHEVLLCKLICLCRGTLSDLTTPLRPYLYGCGFGIHNFLVHSHRHHNGIDSAKLIFPFLESTQKTSTHTNYCYAWENKLPDWGAPLQEDSGSYRQRVPVSVVTCLTLVSEDRKRANFVSITEKLICNTSSATSAPDAASPGST